MKIFKAIDLYERIKEEFHLEEKNFVIFIDHVLK